MAVDKTEKDSDISWKPKEMSSPMFPEIPESTTSSRRGRKKARKVWKRPIRFSRLPSFGFSGSDVTFDQIPAIFSGYTAGSEDSSSSEMSDASGSYSQSVSSADEKEEISRQVSSRAVWKRASLKRMKTLKSISRIPSLKLRRQLTKKLSGGAQTRQKLKKVRSVKLLISRNLGFRDDRSQSVMSGEADGLPQPHYLKPTSSSASKKVGKIQKNLKPNLGATAKKYSGGLTRTRSLRYTGLLRATCSSALKDSKIGNDVPDGKVCTYQYCSLHGHHSHADNVNNVPSLKRFVSMRRRLLKRQKSTNRHLVLLKRSLSRKRGSATGTIVTVRESADEESSQVIVTVDGESNQEIYEDHVSSSEIHVNDVESIRRPPEIHDLSMVDVDENQDGHSGLINRTEPQTPVLSARKRWANLSGDGEESRPAITDETNCRTEIDMQKNVKLWRRIYKQIVTGLGHETENLGAVKSEETAEDSEKFCGESSRSSQDGSGVKEDEDDGKDVQAIEHDKSNAVKLVKLAFDEILSQIPDYSSDDKSITGDKTSKHEHVTGEDEDDRGFDASISKKHFMERDTEVSETASASRAGEETNRRGPKKWSYLKKVILLKRFLKSLENVRSFDHGDPRNLSEKYDEGERERVRWRPRMIGERKNAEEWMLDYALRQVISTLAPSQKRKVDLLVQAFETVFPMDGFNACNLRSRSRPEAARVDAEMEKENNDGAADLQEETDHSMQEQPESENGRCEDHMGKELTSETPALSGCPKSDEAVESLPDPSLCQGESDGSSSCKEGDKKEHYGSETKAGKQNLIKWRNLIYKHMVTSLTVNGESRNRVQDSERLGSADGSRSLKSSSGMDQITGVEEDGNDKDSTSRAVTMVQHALEKILSEIPDRSSDEESVSAPYNSRKQEKRESQGQDTTNGWNNLKKVILLKRLVKSLEKVGKINPGKVRYLPVEPGFEAEKVNLRHRSTQHRNDAEHLMLDYALQQAISRLAPFQIRKVALLVHAFDTVLDESGKIVGSRDDQPCQVSAIPVSDHEALKESNTDITTRINGASCEEEGLSPRFLAGTGVSEIGLKPNQKKDCDFIADEWSVTAGFSRLQVNQRDLGGENGGSVRRESKQTLLSSVRDVKQRIKVEEEKDTKVWSLIYKHMVTGLKIPRDGVDRAYGLKAPDHHRGFHVAESPTSVEDEYNDEGSVKIDVRSSGAVRLVREALEKILSEIPDQSSDGQSVDSDDTTTDQGLLERRFGDELVSSASMAAIEPEVRTDGKAEEITFEPRLEQESRHKPSEKSSRGWNNLKKVILLRRFVKELGTLTKLSPRTPRTLPLESDPEVEKINLRHQPLEGRKSSEEWMLDYALRQVISTLAPSEKRKVSLLAQAFDTISLQDTSSSCSSPSVATSLRMSRQSSTSSLVHSENDACSEISEGRRSVQARDSGGSPEASTTIADAANDRAKRGSSYSKQEVPNYALGDMNEEGTHVLRRYETGEISTEKPIHPREEGEESRMAALDKQQCTSLWRLLCKQMESGIAETVGDQTLLEETSKEEENNDEPDLEHHNADGENMELYQTEAVKLLEEVIDGISLPDSEGDDSRDVQKGNTTSDTKHLEERSPEKDGSRQKDTEASGTMETDEMPRARKGWRNLKRVILLKRFVKALEKVRKFNPREPRFLPPKPDAEAEMVNLRHQETQNKRNGEEWMVDYALQDVVAKLPVARRRKVQLLVQAFETISATGN